MSTQTAAYVTFVSERFTKVRALRPVLVDVFEVRNSVMSNVSAARSDRDMETSNVKTTKILVHIIVWELGFVKASEQRSEARA